MRNVVTLIGKVKSALLIICFYALCLTASAGAPVDVSKVTGNEKVTAQVETNYHLWVGTENGLFQINKSNGKFIQLTTANSVMPSNHVKGICVAGDNVFVATDKGLFRFDGVSYLQLTTENSYLPTNQLTSIASDERGRLFIGTQKHGLVMMENYKCETFNKTNSELTTNTVARVYMDENGLIIACLANGDYTAMGSSTMILIRAQQPATDVTAIN
jgi:ligand-binding sensor domain-containing protein